MHSSYRGCISRGLWGVDFHFVLPIGKRVPCEGWHCVCFGTAVPVHFPNQRPSLSSTLFCNFHYSINISSEICIRKTWIQRCKRTVRKLVSTEMVSVCSKSLIRTNRSDYIKVNIFSGYTYTGHLFSRIGIMPTVRFHVHRSVIFNSLTSTATCKGQNFESILMHSNWAFTGGISNSSSYWKCTLTY